MSRKVHIWRFDRTALIGTALALVFAHFGNMEMAVWIGVISVVSAFTSIALRER